MEGANTSITIDSDLISSLPDDILHHILAFLPTKQAVQTSVLSKRWERLWTSLTSLKFNSSHLCSSDRIRGDAEKKRFSDKGGVHFVKFVNWVLQRRKPLDVFHLDCSVYRSQYAVDWIRYAVQHKTQHLRLKSCRSMTCCIFSCSSLKELDLHDCSVYIYRRANLPNLSKLSVSDMDFNSDNLIELVSGCPILEYLLLRKCVIDEIVIAHAFLKHLSVLNCRMIKKQVLIDTSNLLSLVYEDGLPINNEKVLNMPSLTLASLVSYYHTSCNCKELETLLTAVGNFNHLNLQLNRNWQMGHQVVVSRDLPTFQKLESLSVTCCLGSCVQVVNWILKSSPNMKKFTLLQPEGVESGAGSKSKIAISACKNLQIVEVKYCRYDRMVEKLVDALIDEAKESGNIKILVSKY